MNCEKGDLAVVTRAHLAAPAKRMRCMEDVPLTMVIPNGTVVKCEAPTTLVDGSPAWVVETPIHYNFKCPNCGGEGEGVVLGVDDFLLTPLRGDLSKDITDENRANSLDLTQSKIEAAARVLKEILP